MSSPMRDESKTNAVSIRLTKTQEHYLRARASAKAIGLSDYIRSLIARALRLELAEEKKPKAADEETCTDAFIDSLL